MTEDLMPAVEGQLELLPASWPPEVEAEVTAPPHPPLDPPPPADPPPADPPPADPQLAGPLMPGLRARARADRRRHRRHRLSAVVALLLVVALLVAGVVVLLRHHPAARGAAASTRLPSAAAGPEQTVLLGIGAVGSAAQSVALFGSSPAGHGATLLIPPDTLVDGPGRTVGGSYAINNPGEFAGAVSDLLAVRIDATWRLTPSALAALVDRLGGIQVDVDAAFTSGSLVLAAGPQALGGAQAATYALYLGDEPEQARANRTRLVLDGVLAKLPATLPATLPPSGATALLGSLGTGSGGTLPPDALASSLRALAGSDHTANEEVLPVTTLDAGDTTAAMAIDRSAAPAMISGMFGPAVRKGAGAAGTRVEVVDDSGSPDLATPTRAMLVAVDLTFVGAINDQPFHQYARSSVLVFDSSAASIALGHRIAVALGLPAAPVLVSNQGTGIADAFAVLAGDYRP